MKDTVLLKKLEELTNAISNIAAPVAPIAPIAPVAPVLPLAPINNGDHDLLQRIDTKLERVIADVQKLNDNYSNRIDKLETGKVDKDVAEKVKTDFESRLRVLEKFEENLLGKMSVLAILVAMATTLLVAWIKSMLHI